MLFLEKTDVKKIGEICEGIANGSRVLSAENIVLLDAFHSRLKSIMGIKVGEIARAFYPATKRKFFELKEFYIIDDTMNVTCYDLDAELFTFSFPIKMFDMSTKEIENYTTHLFADQIKKCELPHLIHCSDVASLRCTLVL